MPTFDFTTGPATLPDVGTLSYNGCTFSPLFETQVSGLFVKDDAQRTTKLIEYKIVVDGYVTLPAGATSVESTLATLVRLLSAQGGALVYSGRGINIDVNNGGNTDVAWGPIPELLDIQPLGGGRSAKIKWAITTRIAPYPAVLRLDRRIPPGPVLQFNYDTSVSYAEDGYSSLTIQGIIEIPLTRRTQTNRDVTHTVDFWRAGVMESIIAIDLTRFRITRRDFNISRDKRTMQFVVTAEELPWMAMPPGVTIARGTFTFRPVKMGPGLMDWLCTLSCTYTVRKDQSRSIAWLAFLALLRERMQATNLGALNAPVVPPLVFPELPPIAQPVRIGMFDRLFFSLFAAQNRRPAIARRVFLVDFNGSEGLYLDSKTVTFSATWRLVVGLDQLLMACGLWRRVPELDHNVWAASIRDISGAQSWLRNRIDITGDVIVDFGN